MTEPITVDTLDQVHRAVSGLLGLAELLDRAEERDRRIAQNIRILALHIDERVGELLCLLDGD